MLLSKKLSVIDMKLYWKHFMTAIAALSAAATLLTVLFPLDFIKVKWLYGAIGTIIVLAGSFAYACGQTRSKKKIVLTLSSELKLSILEGNIFEQKGVICIPFNEYFDTHVGDGVVGENTLHGRFINKYFKDRLDELNTKIQNGLPSDGYEIHKRRQDYCPNKKYKLGTCVDIRDGENLYVLFALTHFDENDKASISRGEYTEVIRKLIQHLDDVVEDRAVYMPLFGTGLSRLKRTSQRILLHIVDSIDFNDTCSIPGGIHVVIKSLSDVGVNLTGLEYIVKKGITEIDQIMAQINNYSAFYVKEPFNQYNLGANAAHDFCYYNMLRAWKVQDPSFPFLDAHETTYNVRDDSDWESTLKPRLHERLRNSQNIILFLSENTKNSRALREEIDYGMCILGLPVIVVYPDYSLNSWVTNGNNKPSDRVKKLWDNLPIFRDNMLNFPTCHVPMNKEYITRALRDTDFSVHHKHCNFCWCYD